ncbi:MAG TPA: heme biosynthesis HemY N-terminal domain-containing protein [Stellaceae bacterium]|nr:heme biosynthesis HemY N-terminal domain-containing protein [Stellaceae bacterium]
MRAIFALIMIAALAAAAVFLADNPGRVEIMWQGWQLDTSVGVLITAAALAALCVALVLRLLSLLLGSPRSLLRRRRERRRRAGYQALTRGMVAVAAGDPQEARRYARRAEVLLAEPPLTLLLSAQAAQIGGDELAAKKFFTAMLDRPETEFLGLRGLLNQALREGDRDTARHLAERAVALRANTAWAASSLFDLEARDRRWEAARDALEKVARRRFIAPEIARHHRGVILYELSRDAAAQRDRQRALALAGEARSLTPELATPVAHYARLLLAEGKAGRAAKAIEGAWRTAPHPELAQAYGEMWTDEAPLARVARFERLAAQNPAARESHLALAEAALAAQLWGEARRHLERALTGEPPPLAPLPAGLGTPPPRGGGEGASLAGATPRLCLMMARLEEAEHGDPALMREWLDRAARALPDPRYVCASCGGESTEWRSLCPRCGAFDALAWRTPAWSGSGGALPVTIEASRPTEPTPTPQMALPAGDPARG